MGSFMGESTYASRGRSNQDGKYRDLVEKQIQLEPKDWPKFQEQLKNLHSAELQI